MAQRIIDLSLSLHGKMPNVGFEPSTTYVKDGVNTTNVRFNSHSGTHMDAPRHFIPDGRTIDEVVLEKCIGAALVIDLTHKAENSLITVDDLAPYADRIGPGARLLLRTDWFLNADQPNYRTHFARISPELAQWLVERQVWLLGTEAPSVASLRPGNFEELSQVHQTILRAEIVIVECLARLRDLHTDTVQFIAFPLKLDCCDGSPVRAVAIEERD